MEANPSNYQLNLNLEQANGINSYLEEYFDELNEQCKEDYYYGKYSYIIW